MVCRPMGLFTFTASVYTFLAVPRLVVYLILPLLMLMPTTTVCDILTLHVPEAEALAVLPALTAM